MKKSLLTMLALLSMGSSAFAQESLEYSGPDARVVTARKGVLKVELSSTTSYRDLQFDLTLPAGITLVKESVSPDALDASNVKEAAAGHVIAYNPVGDNSVRFAVYDQTTGKAFTDGVLIEIPVQATDAFKANAVATVTNVVTSDADAKSYAKDNFNINILLNRLGDVNEDGDVDVTDIMAVANWIQKVPTSPFNVGAADITNEDEIDVTDIMGIANIIQGSGNAKVYRMELNIEDTLDPQ